MSMPASRIGDFCTGHTGFSPCPALQGSKDVMLEGRGALRVGDMFSVHCTPDECHSGRLARGSANVKVNGLPLGHIASPLDCGAMVLTGCSTIFAGD